MMLKCFMLPSFHKKLCRFHSDSCRAGRAIHGQSSISGSIAAAWRLAIFEKDWLVHSRNRGLSATVLTCVVEYVLCFPKSQQSSQTGQKKIAGASQICRSDLAPLRV
jgi:hypothetical protein